MGRKTEGQTVVPQSARFRGHGKWELRGVSDAGGKLLPSFEGQLTLVMKRTGGWYIEAYRYTQKPAAVPMPTWLKRPGYPGRS